MSLATAKDLRISDRVAHALNTPTNEFLVVEVCGYAGYRLHWLAPPKAQLIWNLAACEPGKLKQCHRHPARDSVLIFLDGQAEFIMGNGELRPALPGDVLFSVNGGLHGVKNVGDGWARWVYVEGPMPLLTEFPTSEVRAMAAPDAPPHMVEIAKNAVEHMRISLGSKRHVAIVDGGDMSEFGRDTIPAEMRDAVLRPLSGRVMRFGEVRDRVSLWAGSATRVCSPDFGNTKLWVETPALEGQIPLHRRPGCDVVIVLVEGEVEFRWAAEGSSEAQSTQLTPGMVAWAVDGESHGLRNLGSSPAKYIMVAGPQPLGGVPVVPVDGEMPAGDGSIGLGD